MRSITRYLKSYDSHWHVYAQLIFIPTAVSETIMSCIIDCNLSCIFDYLIFEKRREEMKHYIKCILSYYEQYLQLNDSNLHSASMPSLLLCLYAFLFLLNVLLSVICEECRFLYLTSLSCTWVGCSVRSSLVCHNNLYRGSAIYISSPSLTAAHSYELSHTKEREEKIKEDKRRVDKRQEETGRNVTVNDVWEKKASRDEQSNRMQLFTSLI